MAAVLVRHLRVHAVRVGAFDVAEGETVVLEGENGSGKTTLLLAIAGLLPPEAGTVRTLGADPYALPPAARDLFRARRIAFVFQAGNLLPAFDVRENVLLALGFAGLRGAEAGRRADAALDRAGLAALAGRRPADLSGGERQRAAIARAIALEAPLLLADEPTAHLDPRARADVVSLLAEAARGRTAIVVSHDAEARRLGRTVRMEDLG